MRLKTLSNRFSIDLGWDEDSFLFANQEKNFIYPVYEIVRGLAWFQFSIMHAY